MRIMPFRGYRYNLAKIGKLDDVISPPYDQYQQGLDDLLYARHPYNVSRIIMNKESPQDGFTNNRYSRSKALVNQWIHEGVFVQDERPALYPYFQQYCVSGQRTRLRKGFIALGEVTDYDRRIVLPHERTLSKPKQDRLNLLRASLADTGLVLVLYSDPEGKIEALLDSLTSCAADMEALDLHGEVNQLWKTEDPHVIEALQSLMSDKRVIIADGHHRYEVALAFREEALPRAPENQHWGLYAYKLMSFVRLESAGITIFPIHRLVKNVAGFNSEDLLRRLSEDFEIKNEIAPGGEKSSLAERYLDEARQLGNRGENAFVLYLPSIGKMALLCFRKAAAQRQAWPADKTQAWRKLDISVLQTVVLDRLLGIGEKQLTEQSNLEYISEFREAIQMTDQKGLQCALLLNATPIEQVKEVVEAGDLLPQKSTHFHPKLMEGLVFAKHV